MKKRIIILGGVIIAVIGLWSAAWFFFAGMIRQNVEAMALADGVTAPRVTCDTINVSGFPFRFDLDCSAAEIASGDVTVSVPGLRASARVYSLGHVVAWAQGPMTIADSFTGSSNQVEWTTLEASLRLENWRIARGSISAVDVAWSDRLFNVEVARSPLVEVHLFDMPDLHDTERHLAGLSLFARAQAFSWPAMTLNDTNAEVQLELTGLPDDVRNWGDPTLLQYMQQQGAELRVVAIRGTDGDAELNADGQLQLDAQGALGGQIKIASTGVAERVGPMIAEPWRTLVLGAPGPDGSYTNQLNFSGGVMSSGLVPLAQVPPLF